MTTAWSSVDLVILAGVALSVVFGLVRGFVVEAMALLVWCAAALLAWLTGDFVAGWFDPLLPLPSARLALGYALVFFAVLAAGAMLVYLLRALVQGTGLSGTDRLLGSAFGLVRGMLLVTIVVLLAGWTPLPRDPWWRESALLPWFERAADRLAAALPAEARALLDYLPDAGRDDDPPAAADRGGR